MLWVRAAGACCGCGLRVRVRGAGAGCGCGCVLRVRAEYELAFRELIDLESKNAKRISKRSNWLWLFYRTNVFLRISIFHSFWISKTFEADKEVNFPYANFL